MRLALRSFAVLAVLSAMDLVARAPESPLPWGCYYLAGLFTLAAIMAGAIRTR